jgi:hypothetical protein
MASLCTSLLSIPVFAFAIYPKYYSHCECTQLNYAVIPFVPGYNDITGNVLKLDHIADPNLRPLMRPFCVLKNMKCAGL